MTYLLNISFMMKEQLKDAVMTWINNEFIPVITDPAVGFNKFEIFKLISPLDEGHLTLCVQIRSTNRKYLQSWFEQQAFPVCNNLYNKYADADGKGEVVIYPSMMESLN